MPISAENRHASFRTIYPKIPKTIINRNYSMFKKKICFQNIPAEYKIMEAIKRNLNNGVVEGMNNKIKTAFKRSYGFKTEKYRNTMIYLVAGKLDLPTRC